MFIAIYQTNFCSTLTGNFSYSLSFTANVFVSPFFLSVFSHVKQREYITHVLKTDDDCFVNMIYVVDLVINHLHQPLTWIGK